MTDRERLIELIDKAEDICDSTLDCDTCKYVLSGSCKTVLIADYILANGFIVPPCRCKDCTHLRESDTTNRMFCTYHDCEFETFPNNYCSNGIGMVKGA